MDRGQVYMHWRRGGPIIDWVSECSALWKIITGIGCSWRAGCWNHSFGGSSTLWAGYFRVQGEGLGISFRVEASVVGG